MSLRRLTVLAAIAFLAGMGLRIWIAQPWEHPQGVRPPYEAGASVARTDPGLAVANLRGDVGPSSPLEHTVRVAVVDAVSDAAVAEVRLQLLNVEGGRTAALVKVVATLAVQKTDALGTVEFHVALEEHASLFVVAEHPDFIATSASVRQGNSNLVRLTAGSTISGRVVERGTDAGVAAATVWCAADGIPMDLGGNVLLPTMPGALGSTSSDATGRFRLSVPPGMYVLRAGGSEWIAKRPRPGLLDSGAQPVRVAAGTQDVRLEVERFRFVRFELRDVESSTVISQPPVDVMPVERREDVAANGPAALLAPATVLVGGRWSALTSGLTLRPGTYAGVVPADNAMPMDQVGGSIKVLLTVPRYRPRSSRLRLLTRAEFDRGEIDTVFLHRDWDGPVATLEVRVDSPYEGKYVTGRPRIATWDEVGSASSFHVPSATEDGTWVVTGLPARRLRVRVDDGIQLSEEATVDLVPSQNVQVTIHMPPPTGVIVEAESPSGMQLNDVQVFATSADGGQFRVPGVIDSWSAAEAADARLPLLYGLEPGDYDVTVIRRAAVGAFSLPARLSRGEVVRLKGVLRVEVR